MGSTQTDEAAPSAGRRTRWLNGLHASILSLLTMALPAHAAPADTRIADRSAQFRLAPEGYVEGPELAQAAAQASILPMDVPAPRGRAPQPAADNGVGALSGLLALGPELRLLLNDRISTAIAERVMLGLRFARHF